METNYTCPVIVEELCSGRMCTVDGICLPCGKVRFFGIVGTEEDGSGVRSYFTPMDVPDEVASAIFSMSTDLMRGVGFRSGAFSLEWWITSSPESCAVLELNARPSTTFRDIYMARFKEDIVSSAIHLSLGADPGIGEEASTALSRCLLGAGSVTCGSPAAMRAYFHRRDRNDTAAALASSLMNFPLLRFVDGYPTYTEDEMVVRGQGKLQPLAEVTIVGSSKAACDAHFALLENALLTEPKGSQGVNYQVEVLDAKGLGGEGIRADESINGGARWVDYELGQLRTWNPSSGGIVHTKTLPREFNTPYAVARIAGNDGSEILYVSGEHGLGVWTPEQDHLRMVSLPGPAAAVNDLKAGPPGSRCLYFTTLPRNEEPGGLFRLGGIGSDGGETVEELLGGLGYANAIDLRRTWDDGLFELAVVDTLQCTIHILVVSGENGQQCQHADLRPRIIELEASTTGGVPDGLAVDHHGRLWTTEYFGGRVCCWKEDGSLHHAVHLPVANVTDCCFAGADGCTLIATTSSVPWLGKIPRRLAPTWHNPVIDGRERGGATFAVRLDGFM